MLVGQSWWLFVLVCINVLKATANARVEDEWLGGFFKFHSDPDLLSPQPTIINKTSDPALLHPGYIFVAPQGSWGGRYWHGFGPHIYDNAGDLVWNGLDVVHRATASDGTKTLRAIDFKVCDYTEHAGQNLCWSEAINGIGYSSVSRVFNNRYESIAEDFGPTKQHTPQMHDFRPVLGGKSVLQLFNERRPLNLSDYSGPVDGWIKDGCFQELDTTTRESIMEWCVLENLGDLDDTLIYLSVPENTDQHTNLTSNISGNGSYHRAWDHIHLNSIDFTSENDYIISLRHWDQIVKVAGRNNLHGLKPGSVMWRLGGKMSDFELQPGTDFTKQHHPTSLHITQNEEDVLLFDNAWEGINPSSAPFSSAKLIRLNNESMTATLIQSYDNPQGLKSAAKGSAQQLSNRNIFVGWGTQPQVSEFAENGDLLLHLQFCPLHYNAYAHSYRSFKFDWMGQPTQPPKLLAYRFDCQSPLVVYVSWNGATEVHRWRVSVRSNSYDQWTQLEIVRRTGFETKASFDIGNRTVQHVLVEPLDASENVLFHNTYREIWIPVTAVQLSAEKSSCSAEGCVNNTDVLARFTYPEALNGNSRCLKMFAPNYLGSAFVVVFLVVIGVLIGIISSIVYYRRYSVVAFSESWGWPFDLLRRGYEPVKQDDIEGPVHVLDGKTMMYEH